jgi:hypothetical protein
MNSKTTTLWDISISSLRRDEVLGLLKLGLEADSYGDVASDCEAIEWSDMALGTEETNRKDIPHAARVGSNLSGPNSQGTLTGLYCDPFP